MLEDAAEVTPGSAAFWDAFYDAQETRARSTRHAADITTLRAATDDDDIRNIDNNNTGDKDDDNDDDTPLLDHYEWFMGYSAYATTLQRCLTTLGVVADVDKCGDGVAAARGACAAAAADACCNNNNNNNNNSKSRHSRRAGRRQRRLCASTATATATAATLPTLRVLHVGCGSSDFCDGVQRTLAPVAHADVLNVDVCRRLIARLRRRYAARRYAVGDACALVGTRDDADVCASPLSPSTTTTTSWYVVDGDPPVLRGVHVSRVDVVFDKGTADALLSAFAGRDNANMHAYAQQALHVLRVGGVFFVVSINAVELLNAYVLAACVRDERNTDGDDASSSSSTNSSSDGSNCKSFVLRYRDVLARPRGAAHIESLASQYSCYGYLVVQTSSTM